MILSIGSYDHPARKAWISVSKRERLSRINRRKWFDVDIFCGGTLAQKNGDVGVLTAQMDALDAAMTSGQDIVLYEDDGTTETHHAYASANTVDGIRLLGFRWVKGAPGNRNAFGSGVENLYRRSWTAHFFGRFIAGAAEEDYTEWFEWVEQIGDGTEKWRSKGSIGGTVDFQQLQAFTSITLLQGGHAKALSGPPVLATALVPSATHDDLTRIRRITPEWGVNTNVEYGGHWFYHMEYASGGPYTPTPLP